MQGEQIPHKMLSQDAFSTWLGIEILECEIGRCRVAMTVRKEMLNSISNKAPPSAAPQGGVRFATAPLFFCCFQFVAGFSC